MFDCKAEALVTKLNIVQVPISSHTNTALVTRNQMLPTVCVFVCVYVGLLYVFVCVCMYVCTVRSILLHV